MRLRGTFKSRFLLASRNSYGLLTRLVAARRIQYFSAAYFGGDQLRLRSDGCLHRPLFLTSVRLRGRYAA